MQVLFSLSRLRERAGEREKSETLSPSPSPINGRGECNRRLG